MIDIFYRVNKELASWIAIWRFLRGLDRHGRNFYRDIDEQADLSNNAEIKKDEFQTTRRCPPVMRDRPKHAPIPLKKHSVGSGKHDVAVVRYLWNYQKPR